MAMQRVVKKARGTPPAMLPMSMMGGMMPQMMGGMMPMGMPMQQMMANMMNAAGAVDEEHHDELEEGVTASSDAASGQAARVSVPENAPPPPPPLMEDGVGHRQRPVDQLISRSVTYVKQLPRNRISEALEQVSAVLDSTFTAELSPEGCLTLLWLFCRIKPSVKISDLRPLAE